MEGMNVRYALALMILALGGCGARPSEKGTPNAIQRVWGPPSALEPVRLATTTSTENTGLLDRLLPPFEKRFGVKVHVIAVGTGQALMLGRSGDVDVVLVHDPEAEDAFVQEGAGVNRRSVMWNDFVLVGPASDPAGAARTRGAAEALSQIAATKSTFVSRGDNSGTHVKEKALWQTSGIKPQGNWYLEAGQGMGATLLMADEKRGYSLTDRGTYLAFKGKVRLQVLVEGGEVMKNPYSIIAVNPARRARANYLGAMMLIAWVTSREGQKIIGDFKIGGERLFHPSAGPEVAEELRSTHPQ